MERFLRIITGVFLILYSRESICQLNTDSIHILIKKEKGVKKANLYMDLANSYVSSFPDSTLFYADLVEDIGRTHQNTPLIIRSYLIKAQSYQFSNKLDKSIDYNLKAATLAEKNRDYSLLGNAYNGLGTCYYYLQNNEKAEHYLSLAIEAKKEAHDFKYYSIILSNLAGIKMINGNKQESLRLLLDAEKTLIKNKEFNYLATIYNSIGANYQLNSNDSCVFYYKKSIELASHYKDQTSMVNGYQNLGDFYVEKKQFSTAIEYMLKALSKNKQRIESNYTEEMYIRISGVYDSIGDYKNAYKYNKLAIESYKRTFNIEKQKEIEKLEIKYQTEKKEREIQAKNQEIEKSKNQRNIILFITLLILLTTIFIIYQIFQKRKITQDFERQKLKLFENIVHDIRTPLTLISGPVQVLKQSITKENETNIELIERNSTKLIRLVNELLDTSKLGKGNYQAHYDSGNIDDHLQSIIHPFLFEAQSKNIEVKFQKIGESDIYTYPSDILEKIVSNLLDNAIRYSSTSSTIQIIASIKNKSLHVEVSDSGPGIPKKDQKKIFNRFYRGKNTLTTTGSGIGLSLVKELTELVGGKIELNSDKNGSSFTITIPIQKHQTVVKNELQNNTELPSLLLVEDDNDMANFTSSLFSENYSIIRVKDGQEALQTINHSIPDIILSDVMLPIKDGIELLQEVKSNELTNHIPFVLFSAKASLESKLKGLKYGANAYIPKPFSPDELKLTIQNLYTTIQFNKEEFNTSVNTEKPFEDRVKSKNTYINKIIEKVILNLENSEYSVNELANDMSISRSQLHRKISSLTGYSTTNFIRMIRLEKAKDLLKINDGNITEIAYKCGFNSQSYFSKLFTEYFGKAPREYYNTPSD